MKKGLSDKNLEWLIDQCYQTLAYAESRYNPDLKPDVDISEIVPVLLSSFVKQNQPSDIIYEDAKKALTKVVTEHLSKREVSSFLTLAVQQLQETNDVTTCNIIKNILDKTKFLPEDTHSINILISKKFLEERHVFSLFYEKPQIIKELLPQLMCNGYLTTEEHIILLEQSLVALNHNFLIHCALQNVPYDFVHKLLMISSEKVENTLNESSKTLCYYVKELSKQNLHTHEHLKNLYEKLKMIIEDIPELQEAYEITLLSEIDVY